MSVSYRFQYSDSSTGPWVDISGTSSSSPVTKSGIPSGDYLWFRIVTSDTSVNSIESASTPIEILVAGIPFLSGDGTEKEFIHLQWTPACVDHYDIYRYNDSTFYWQKVGTTTENSWRDIFASMYVEYRYYIVGVTESGRVLSDSNVCAVTRTPEGIINMSTSRATLYQGIQIGIEATPGTGVDATKRLVGIDMDLTPEIPIKPRVHAGTKGATGVQKGHQKTDISFNAELDFNLMQYLLTLMYGAAAATTDGTAGIRKISTWNPSALAGITPKTATIEQGSAAGAEKVAFAILNEMKIKFSREEASIEGGGFAGEYLTNQTLTSGLSEIAIMPVNPSAIGCYVSLDGASWTLLEDVLDGEINMSGLWKPVFHKNDTINTFDKVVETQPNFGVVMTVEDGSEADDFMTRLSNGTKVWLGIKALGPEIESTKNYEFIMRMPTYVVKPDPGDKDDVFGSTFSCDLAHDATYGMMSMILKNLTATI